MSPDVLIVGSGMVGMACAWAGVQRGLKVEVVERDVQCVGASIRNFGLITVTGQGRGDTWRRARRSRDVWAELAPQAGIEVVQQGLWVLARRPQGVQVLQQLLTQPEGQDLRWLDAQALREQAPVLAHGEVLGALYSPHELRIESRLAVEQLRLYLQACGVRFHMGQAVQQVARGVVHTTQGPLHAGHVLVCPGPDVRSLCPEVFERRHTRLCQLQMLRVRPPAGYVLPAPVMGELSLVRYRGFSELPAAAVLTQRMQAEQQAELDEGIHLIIVQSADGTLVVGDSHHYGQAMPPFASAQVEALILAEMQRLLQLPHFEVVSRWTGIYPSAEQDAFIDTAAPGVEVISVTSGTGMSTAFGLAEDWIQTCKAWT